MYKYNVNSGSLKSIVNFQIKLCSCKVLNFDQYPCDHHIVICRECNTTQYNMCSHYYIVDSYYVAFVESIYPIPN